MLRGEGAWSDCRSRVAVAVERFCPWPFDERDADEVMLPAEGAVVGCDAKEPVIDPESEVVSSSLVLRRSRESADFVRL